MDFGKFLSERRSAMLFSVGALAITVVAAGIFISMHEREPIYAGPGVTKQAMLSASEPSLLGGSGDTPVFELEGVKKGPTITILGGTHAQETAGMLAAILVIENAKVRQGKLIVVPQANQTGLAYTDPMEAYLHSFTLPLPDGSERWFRVGMRLGNPADQWPDPDVYIHKPSNEELVGHESRNLNRNHPGREEGWVTARIAHGLFGLAKQSQLVFDMHEAQPEYPVINKFVAHDKSLELANTAQFNLAGEKVTISTDKSPKNLHGLSHRELGDFTAADVVLAETANPSMGRFRGRTSLDLVVNGRDVNYLAASKLGPSKLGKLFVTWDENGWPLKTRVARHLAAISALIEAYNDLHPDNQILVDNIPKYQDVITKGIGAFLMPPKKA